MQNWESYCMNEFKVWFMLHVCVMLNVEFAKSSKLKVMQNWEFDWLNNFNNWFMISLQNSMPNLGVFLMANVKYTKFGIWFALESQGDAKLVV